MKDVGPALKEHIVCRARQGDRIIGECSGCALMVLGKQVSERPNERIELSLEEDLGFPRHKSRDRPSRLGREVWKGRGL